MQDNLVSINKCLTPTTKKSIRQVLGNVNFFTINIFKFDSIIQLGTYFIYLIFYFLNTHLTI